MEAFDLNRRLVVLSDPPRRVRASRQLWRGRALFWAAYFAPVVLALMLRIVSGDGAPLPAWEMIRTAHMDRFSATAIAFYTLLLGGPMLFVESQYWRQALMLRRGRMAVATIHKIRRLSGCVCDITYTFDANEQFWTQTRRVNLISVDDLHVGHTVSVLYLPRRPQSSMLAMGISQATLSQGRGL